MTSRPFKIEKNIPVPPEIDWREQMSMQRRGWAWHLANSQIGDSVFVMLALQQIQRSTHNYGTGWYRAMSEGAGHRVWKVAEPTWPRGRQRTLRETRRAGGVTE